MKFYGNKLRVITLEALSVQFGYGRLLWKRKGRFMNKLQFVNSKTTVTTEDKLRAGLKLRETIVT